MFNQEVTVINYYRDRLTKLEMWTKTYIKGCMWHEIQVTSVNNNTIQSDDAIECTILDLTNYVPYKQFLKLTNDQKLTKWTINPSKGQDYIVLGHVTEEINENYTPDDLIKDYDNVATVLSFSDNSMTDRLKNFKVLGK